MKKPLMWYSNAGELALPRQCVLDCSASGSVDSAVAYWVPRIDWSACSAAGIRQELKEHGAWSATELRDNEQNRHRILWIACCEVREQERP